MPSRRYDLTLGFIGQGEVSEKNAHALLTDLIKANGKTVKVIVPMTTDQWSDGLATVVEFAEEKNYYIEAVVNDDTKAAKKHLPLARKTHSAEDVVTTLVNLLAPSLPNRLIVLWDDDDRDVEGAALAASEAGIEVLDLTQGLDTVEVEEEGAEEGGDEEGEKETSDGFFSQKQLLDLTKGDDADLEELEALADQYGIDIEEIEEWEDVAKAIFEAQDASVKTPEGEDEDEAVTPEAVDSWEFNELKAFAKEHKIEVAPRTKSAGFRVAIKAWLGEGDVPEEDVAIPDPKQAPGSVTRAAEGGHERGGAMVSDETMERLVTVLERLAECLDALDAPKRPKRDKPSMTPEEAQEIVDDYEAKGRRRGRPPAEVTEARRALDLD